jgi:sodium-dependent dicarboxylate transporter 2/3/5
LFVIPVDARRGQFVLDWKTAAKVPWGVLLLFGGGLSLAAGFHESGLSEWIGHRVAVFDQLPLVLLVLLTTGTILLLTELTSNTATANVFLPILGAAALGLGLDPMVLLLPAGMAASCAFMMPVATPPNAIVFGSGHVRIGQMVKAGVWLNLIGLVVVTALTFLMRPWVLPGGPG